MAATRLEIALSSGLVEMAIVMSATRPSFESSTPLKGTAGEAGVAAEALEASGVMARPIFAC